MSARREYINPAGLRLDGRRPHESRRLTVEFGRVAGCDGSCTLTTGLSTVCAMVHGPREAGANTNNNTTTTTTTGMSGGVEEAMLTCEVAVAAFAGDRRRDPRRHSRLAEELSAAVLAVARSVVVLTQYPRSQIHICVEVLRQEGSDKATCINAACLALIDASVAMRDVVYTQTVGVLDGVDVVDLSSEEIRSQCPTICMAVKGHDPSSIIWMESTSRVGPEVITRLVTLAQESTKSVFANSLQPALKEHAARILKLQGKISNLEQ